MSTGGEFLFLLCGTVAVLTAVLTITMRTPLRAAMTLLAHIVSLAGLYLTLHAHLLAAIQLIVYAGAVVVLFVFVIMLMGPGAMESQPSSRGLFVKTLGAGLVVLTFGAIAFAVGKTNVETRGIPVCDGAESLRVDEEGRRERECDEFGGVNALSNSIFRQAAIPFELVSLLLLVAIISAIAIAKGRTSDEKKTIDDLETRKRSPRPFAGDPAGPTLNPGTVTRPTGQSIPDPAE